MEHKEIIQIIPVTQKIYSLYEEEDGKITVCEGSFVIALSKVWILPSKYEKQFRVTRDVLDDYLFTTEVDYLQFEEFSFFDPMDTENFLGLAKDCALGKTHEWETEKGGKQSLPVEPL